MNKLFFAISVFLILAELCHTDDDQGCQTDDQGMVKEWWKNVVIYQIYIRSFKDSDGNGVGDLRGIIDKAEIGFFEKIGVRAIWITPIYVSPLADFGYDISNYRAIDPTFGTIDDFTELVRILHSKGLYILLDFVPNHTSNQHEWFLKSINRTDPYTDYYVWRDPKGWNGTTPIPPNNWVTAFEGSAWQYDDSRKQFYLHQFLKEEPDLNYRNPQVVQEMLENMNFWLAKGVDGFRMDAVPYLCEDELFRDEPVICTYEVIPGIPATKCLDHIYTQNQPETFTKLEDYRSLLDNYTMKDGSSHVVLAETYVSLDYLPKYYGTNGRKGAQLPFNFAFLDNCTWNSTAYDFKYVIDAYINAVPPGGWWDWVLGNHDRPRVADRFGVELSDGMTMLSMLLPGTAISYQGEELEMTDTRIRWDETKDYLGLNAGPDNYELYSRDPQRTPYQWDSSLNAGFSTDKNETWLPINPNFWRLNLEAEQAAVRSHLKLYQNLTKLRLHDVFRKGAIHTYVLAVRVFAFTRTLDGFEPYVVIVNFDSTQQLVNLSTYIPGLKEKLYVYISSLNSEHLPEDVVCSYELVMRPKSSLVLSSECPFVDYT